MAARVFRSLLARGGGAAGGAAAACARRRCVHGGTAVWARDPARDPLPRAPLRDSYTPPEPMLHVPEDPAALPPVLGRVKLTQKTLQEESLGDAAVHEASAATTSAKSRAVAERNRRKALAALRGMEEAVSSDDAAVAHVPGEPLAVREKPLWELFRDEFEPREPPSGGEEMGDKKATEVRCIRRRGPACRRRRRRRALERGVCLTPWRAQHPILLKLPKLDAEGVARGTGRRKTSVAQVAVKHGDGAFLVCVCVRARRRRVPGVCVCARASSFCARGGGFITLRLVSRARAALSRGPRSSTVCCA